MTCFVGLGRPGLFDTGRPVGWIHHQPHHHWPVKITSQASHWRQKWFWARRTPESFPIESHTRLRRKLAMARWTWRLGTPPSHLGRKLARMAAGYRNILIGARVHRPTWTRQGGLCTGLEMRLSDEGFGYASGHLVAHRKRWADVSGQADQHLESLGTQRTLPKELEASFEVCSGQRRLAGRGSGNILSCQLAHQACNQRVIWGGRGMRGLCVQDTRIRQDQRGARRDCFGGAKAAHEQLAVWLSLWLDHLRQHAPLGSSR